MKAIRIVEGTPTLVETSAPTGDGVLVNVVSASICGSDLHLIDGGLAEGMIMGHELAGTTQDGKGVAIEPIGRCGSCLNCDEGRWNHCDSLAAFGVFQDGGMAEQIMVPPECIQLLPSGMNLSNAAIIEPLAVAVHGLHRTRPKRGERIAIIGAGPIGVALAAVCRAEGFNVDVTARHDHQRAAIERLGGNLDVAGDYDIVFDAVGTPETLTTAINASRHEGRVGLVGSLWEPATIDVGLCLKEVEIVPSMMYCGEGETRDFARATAILEAEPAIADTMLTHRFPLDAATEGFAAARDRSGGAIKVVFDVTAS